MLEDTNSLDGAHFIFFKKNAFWPKFNALKFTNEYKNKIFESYFVRPHAKTHILSPFKKYSKQARL